MALTLVWVGDGMPTYALSCRFYVNYRPISHCFRSVSRASVGWIDRFVSRTAAIGPHATALATNFSQKFLICSGINQKSSICV